MNSKNDTIQAEINANKQLLAQTDYQALKFAEGAISEEDYAPVRAKRQAWRDKVNELEAQLESE
jgi:hypothetical protein